MRRKWFMTCFFKSITRRKGRIAIASLSVTLAVLVVTGMLGISIGINEKLGSELRAYGANIIVYPETGSHFDQGTLDVIAAIKNVDSAEGQLLGSAVAGRRSVEIIGLDTESIKHGGWRLYGDWPDRRGEILAGINLKGVQGFDKDGTVHVEHEGRVRAFTVSGFIERGGAEDRALLLQLADAWELTGQQGRLSTVLVRGRSGDLDAVIADIGKAVPSAVIKTFRQVALAERSLLDKIQLLMIMVTAVVLFAAGVSVTGTMGANVLERREEIGLMKAIGATQRDIGLFYKAEALLMGLTGGFAGFVLGSLSAQVISKGAFNSYIHIPVYMLPISLAAGIVLSFISSHFPVRNALKANPAVILRGE